MSFFNTKTLKAEISRLEKLERSNQLRLKKIQNGSQIKLDKNQYLKYKEILFNHSRERKNEEPKKENSENKNTINLPKKVFSSYDILPQKVKTQSEDHTYSPTKIDFSKQNLYEFPFQKLSPQSIVPTQKEISVQTEKDTFFKNQVLERGKGEKQFNEELENMVILEEMNPNLSFSSCPMSDIKVRPLTERLSDLKTYKDENFDSFQKNVRDNIFISEEEKNQEFRDEEENIYKKINFQKSTTSRLDSDRNQIYDDEGQVINSEYQNLLEQRKLLEIELESLKKLQDQTCKRSFVERKRAVNIEQVDSEMINKLQTPKGNLIELEVEENTINHSQISEKHDNNDSYETTNENYSKEKQGRMSEDEWKIGQEIWRNKENSSKENFSNKNRKRVENILHDNKENINNNSSEKKKLFLKELVDSVGASLEEIKKRKLNGTPEFKKNKEIMIEKSVNSNSIRELGSGSRSREQLDSILEEEDE